MKPKQAVILAGGKGTRLRPITYSIPKSMIKFNDLPFLEHLICMLKEQGFKKILILTGYLHDIIENYFNNGSKWGIEIEYSFSNVENETGKRLKIAESKIENIFFLMYCDNYWPIDFNKMWGFYKKSNVDALVTVYNNDDNYTKSNMIINKDGIVKVYDKTRTIPDLKGVDIGFLILNKKVLNLIPQGNVSFEKNVYPQLIENKNLVAYITEHRYYSVGSIERLNLTNSFFSSQPTIILDRDGVINKKLKKGTYVCKWEDWIWNPGSVEAIFELKKSGYRIIIITNQAGIARGFMTESDLFEIHHKMRKHLLKNGGDIDKIYFCPHGWNDSCNCRKPKPGMLFQAQRDFNINLHKTYFIGDDIRDIQAGEKAGCKTIMLNKNHSLLELIKEHDLI